MLVKEGHDIPALIKDNLKLEGMVQGLERKALITDDFKITHFGTELLEFMNSKIAVPIVKKKPSLKEFDEWWECYPSTDQFEHGGRVFTGSRGMRVQKEKCKLKFNAILNEGVYTAQQIIDSTKLVVKLKKDASVNKRSNELTYLQNSYTFLDGGYFKPFVELLEKGVPITGNQPQISGGTDI
jgi:hypothetical protein